MGEWGVYLVIASLVGFLATVIPPIIKLNTSITKLTVTMDNITDDLKGLTERNRNGHERLWDKNNEQDARISDHETRIGRLENEKGVD